MAGRLRVAVLVSGEGTTFEGLADAFDRREANAEIVLVLADRPGVPAIARAERRGLPAGMLPRPGVDPSGWSRSAETLLRERKVELVVLAGFLSVVPSEFLRAFPGRIINVHPSLLPRHGGPGMYGRRVHEAVLRSGDAETGATVHLVTDELDGGTVLAQARLPVPPRASADDLRAVLRPVEIRTLVDVIAKVADGTWPLPLSRSTGSSSDR